MVTLVHAVLYSAVALALLWWGGNAACRLLLNLTGLKDATADAEPDHALKVGRVIGGLERLIIAIGLLYGVWEAIAAVIALKTIARFKEIDHKIPAEYFLVGSLFSLLWGIVVTSGWTVYDRELGSKLQSRLVAASSTTATPKKADVK